MGDSREAKFDISAKKGIWEWVGTLGPFCSLFYREQSVPEGGLPQFKGIWAHLKKIGSLVKTTGKLTKKITL